MPMCKNCGEAKYAFELDRNELCEHCARQARAANLQKSKAKSCSYCGDHGLFLYIDSDGLCDNCRPKVEAERREKRRQEALRSNYEILKAGKAEPDLQRTYDAFHRKYPNALITGVQVTGDSARINVYLAGGQMYHVRFNPLTNDVDVSKPSSSVDQSQISGANFYDVAPQEKKKGGCLSAVFKGVCWVVGSYVLFVVFVSLFSVIFSDDPSDSKYNASKATASPTATAEAGDALSWAKYYSGKELPSDISLRDVYTETSAGEKILIIEYFMSPMREGEDYLLAAAQTIINAGGEIRSHDLHKDFDSVNFLFYGGFIDKYGNRSEDVGIRAWYDKSDFELLNFKHFSDYLYSDPSRIIEASDESIIHPAYLK